jgi:hypothetical protein
MYGKRTKREETCCGIRNGKYHAAARIQSKFQFCCIRSDNDSAGDILVHVGHIVRGIIHYLALVTALAYNEFIPPGAIAVAFLKGRATYLANNDRHLSGWLGFFVRGK